MFSYDRILKKYMTIFIQKFGAVLTSRQAGREAYLAFLPTLSELKKDEQIIIDFSGINTFSPSWGDEFLTPIQKQYGDMISLKNTSNPSVNLTIKTLENANNIKFKISKN